MPPTCSVCSHDARDDVDRLLIGGRSARSIALKHPPLTEWAVNRHKLNHLSPALAKIEAQRGGRLLNRVEALITRTEAILSAAEESGRINHALAAVRELSSLLRLLGAASGELDERPSVTVNLMQAPEWLAIRSRLLAALTAYPEARAAVVAALSGADGAEYSEPRLVGSSATTFGAGSVEEGPA